MTKSTGLRHRVRSMDQEILRLNKEIRCLTGERTLNTDRDVIIAALEERVRESGAQFTRERAQLLEVIAQNTKVHKSDVADRDRQIQLLEEHNLELRRQQVLNVNDVINAGKRINRLRATVSSLGRLLHDEIENASR